MRSNRMLALFAAFTFTVVGGISLAIFFFSSSSPLGVIEKNLPFFSNPTREALGMRIDVVSKLPGYTIPSSSINPQRLKDALTKLDVYPLSSRPFADSKQSKFISPKQITVTFYPATLYQKKLSLNKDTLLILNSTEYYQLGAWNPTTQSLAISVYLDMDKIKKNIKDPVDLVLSRVALEAIFFQVSSPTFANLENPVKEFNTRLGDWKQPLFQVNKTSSFRLVPKAFAAVPVCGVGEVATGCNGNVSCGTRVSSPTGTCSNDPIKSCSVDRTCAPGTCVFPQTCEPNGETRSCGFNGSQCVQNTCPSCMVSEACAIQCAPAPPPATSPTPTPIGSVECDPGSVCFPGISNCGQVGYVGGNGVCTGGLCCKPASGPLPPTCTSASVSVSNRDLRLGGQGTVTVNVNYAPVNPQTQVIVHLSQVNPNPAANQVLLLGPAKQPTWSSGWRVGVSSFQTSVWGNLPNNAQVHASVIVDNGLRDTCSDNSPVIIASAAPTSTPTPIPTGTVQARGHIVSSDISCSTIAGAPDLTQTQFTLSPVVAPGSQTQSGASYVTWNSAPAGGLTYILTEDPPAGYVLANACYSKTGGAPYSSGLSATLGTGETLQWNVGYTQGTAWVQTQGGDVRAKERIKSLMTSLASPRRFSIDGAGSTPGVVFYGSSGVVPYDFDEGTGQGETYVSSKKWLVNEPGDGLNNDPYTTDWYEYFLSKFDLSPASNPTPDYSQPNNVITKPASRTTPYLVSGNMETSGNWVIGASESIILFVTGNATIKGTITITPGGFFAVIANGSISVDPTVGVAAASSTPVVEGIYITSRTGSFATGQSTVAGKERFVGKGTFIAGSFLLQRDLSSVSANPTTSAELFIYNPQLLLTMPDKMKDFKTVWQEVAP